MHTLPKVKRSHYNGQATLLAILIATAVAVVTAVGVSTRQNSSFRRTTYTTQTDQSFSCANSGVDAALLCITEQEKSGETNITTIMNACKQSSPKVVADGSCSYTTEIFSLLTGFTINPITPGQVQQINTSNQSSVELIWQDADADSSTLPALEVTYAYNNGGNYEMKKFAIRCLPSTYGGANLVGFEDTYLNSGVCTKTFTLSPVSSESIVRIKPLFSNASVKVNISGSNSQGYSILSHGKAGNAVRNIEVLRMNPQLPALFDYVLYSEEGDIKK